ncbi:MAG TPA: DUF362 domain-containing protein [Candidatus Brocadiia bacterium]|nr:DUF362 domain-containing protein [Candidatus Brocadiia bacterium]
MSDVLLSECRKYETGDVRKAVARSFEFLESQGALPARGATVVLKPNLLSSMHAPDRMVNTHPSVIEAVAGVLIADLGCKVLIGDSCCNLTPRATRKAMEIMGYPGIAERTGAEMCNFDEVQPVEVEVAGFDQLQSVLLPKPLREADYILNLPKLKTHGLTFYTGAVKNTLGCVPGERKKRIHVVSAKASLLCRALVDVFSVVKPNASIMDAVTGMEGNGPSGGSPRDIGMIAAATDAVAMDAVGADLIGYGPRDITTTINAAERGLGTADLKRIEIKGDPPDAFRVRDFRKPLSYHAPFALDWMPHWMSNTVVRWIFEMNASIDMGKCKRCELCLKNCPVNAISVEGEAMVVDEDKCIACFCCEEVCPHKAIRVSRKGFGRYLPLKRF